VRHLLALSLTLAGCTYDFDEYTPRAEPATDAAAADTRSDAPLACPTDGRMFGGRCYFLLTGTRDFDQSRAACEAQSAHLATVTSAEEQVFVQAMGSGDRWIGLRKSGTEFIWITGETSSYARWGSGEPNGSGDCARIRSTNDWGDQSCRTAYSAICERE
jgi:hypothetical protein